VFFAEHFVADREQVLQQGGGLLEIPERYQKAA
jgi:hypothetical protein